MAARSFILTGQARNYDLGPPAVTPRGSEWLRCSTFHRKSELVEGAASLRGRANAETGELCTRQYEHLWRRACAIIEQKFNDPGFGAQVLAREMRISRRLLEVAFAAQAQTIVRRLWDVRLQAAAEMLLTPEKRKLTLLEIATGCGFVSAAHFSRRFRDRFGVSPSCYRRRSEHRETHAHRSSR